MKKKIPNNMKMVTDEIKVKIDMKKLKNNLKNQTEDLECFLCRGKLRKYTQDGKNYVCDSCEILYYGMTLDMIREITKLRKRLNV